MSSLDLSAARLEALAHLALTAGHEIERFRAAGFGARHKEDGSLVTEADHAAQAIILDGLEVIAHDIPVVAEEEAAAGVDPACGGRFFLVDPLDGTRDFVETDLGEYTVNIAYVEAGRPRLGVIYAPAHDALYAGGPSGAWRQVKGVREALLRPAVPASSGLRAVVSRRSRGAQLERFLAAAAPGGRVVGSSAMKFTRLADGEADLYPRFSPVSEWDVAAGDALLSALGGGVMTPEGAPLPYGQRVRRYEVSRFIAFSNDAAKQAALAAWAPAG
jgi:3'(2'), 5'-bisphosphate nucleotidase